MSLMLNSAVLIAARERKERQFNSTADGFALHPAGAAPRKTTTDNSRCGVAFFGFFCGSPIAVSRLIDWGAEREPRPPSSAPLAHRREPDADGVQFDSARNGWLPFVGPSRRLAQRCVRSVFDLDAITLFPLFRLPLLDVFFLIVVPAILEPELFIHRHPFPSFGILHNTNYFRPGSDATTGQSQHQRPDQGRQANQETSANSLHNSPSINIRRRATAMKYFPVGIEKKAKPQ